MVTEVPAAPVLALMAFGVLLAMAGSAAKSNLLLATGLAILFLATAAMVVGGFLAFQRDPKDPRPERSGSGATSSLVGKEGPAACAASCS